MATKRKSAVSLSSWDDVDRCLKEIAECEIAVETIEAEMQMRINDAKSEAERLGKPIKDNIERIKLEIQTFSEEAKAYMNGKTKELNFGKVGFRLSTSISIPTKKFELILSNIKKFGMTDCITLKESINKDALKFYDDANIVKIGAMRKIEDKFFCEVDREKIRR